VNGSRKKVWGLLSSMDRLQGTAGLIEAAEIISQEASNLGLDVVARTYQYDGKETIMGLTMPLGWELTDGYCELVSPIRSCFVPLRNIHWL